MAKHAVLPAPCWEIHGDLWGKQEESKDLGRGRAQWILSPFSSPPKLASHQVELISAVLRAIGIPEDCQYPAETLYPQYLGKLRQYRGFNRTKHMIAAYWCMIEWPVLDWRSPFSSDIKKYTHNEWTGNI